MEQKTCEKHPKYKGKKLPTYLCADCFSMYMRYLANKHRSPIMPTKQHKDKTKYTRKQKHKKTPE